jgi:PAB-dependent poly(A)-specific ribonuclease subunit 3
LSNAGAIAKIKEWKHVYNGGVVSVVNAFTTQAFGDSSLIFVYNYHPMSKTLAEHHFAPTNRYGHRAPANEQVLWSYVVQIASAIKAVHGNHLAVRCLDASKVILTEKNRVRLSACAVLDVVQFEANRPIQELQQEDFLLFGRLMLSLASNNPHINITAKISVDGLLRAYTPDFRSAISWLLTPAHIPGSKNITDFLASISSHLVTSYDMVLHAEDALRTDLYRELENGRLVRLLTKLDFINERPEYEGDMKWSEYGERYILKLFRDYVFHAIDAETRRPKLDLGHVLVCLNKLDAGTNEQIRLDSQDGVSSIIVTYKELKKQAILAFADLEKRAGAKGGRY